MLITREWKLWAPAKRGRARRPTPKTGLLYSRGGGLKSEINEVGRRPDRGILLVFGVNGSVAEEESRLRRRPSQWAARFYL